MNGGKGGEKNRDRDKNSRSNGRSPTASVGVCFSQKVMTIVTIIIRLIGAPPKSRHNGINLNQQRCSQAAAAPLYRA